MEEREGQAAEDSADEINQKEEDSWEKRMQEGEYRWDPSRKERVKEIQAMEIEDIERELFECGWVCKPEDSIPVTTEELLAEVKE